MDVEARLAALERQHTLLQARHDLWETMARYVRAIDDQREEELAAILTDDVVFQTHPWTQGPLRGKALALKALRNYRRAFQCPRHFLTNQQLAIHDSGTATGSATWLVVQAREEQSYCGWGTYELDFRCADGLWQISRLLVTLDCMTTLERGWGMVAERILPFPPRAWA